MSPSPDQLSVIRSCKGLVEPESKPFRILLLREGGEEIGSIRPIDRSLAGEEQTAIDMTRWRTEAGGNFLTEFSPTVERTKEWLNQVVVPKDDRILFLIEDEQGRRIGHFGIASIAEHSLELDNGIRGEAGGNPKLFNYVELYVMHFAFSCLQVDQVNVRVFADNMGARRLHRTIGFTEKRREKLVRARTDDGEFQYLPVEFTEAPEGEEEREQIHLSMNRAEFYSKYSWLEKRVLR